MKNSTAKPLPPLALLNELFIIDQTTPSGLRRKKETSRSFPSGSPVGSQNSAGYWVVCIKTDKTRQYYCHRIVVYMQTGKDPGKNQIDHINGKTNENPQNLRIVNYSKNQANRKKQTHRSNVVTSSKYKGVSWKKGHKKWESYIRVNKKRKLIGYFGSEEEAAEAYNEAAIFYFGEFARLNQIEE